MSPLSRRPRRGSHRRERDRPALQGWRAVSFRAGVFEDEFRQAVPVNQPDAPERSPPPDAGGFDSAGLQ